jgi:hypothetical protein
MYKELVQNGTTRPDWEHCRPSIEGHLKEWEKKLEVLQEKKPDDKVILADLLSKKTTGDATEQKRLQKTGQDSLAAVEKHKRLREGIVRQQELLAEKLAALDNEFAEVQQLWAADEASRLVRHRHRSAAWTARITAATPAAVVAAIPVAEIVAPAATPAVVLGTPPPTPAVLQADHQLAVKWDLVELPDLGTPTQIQLVGLDTLWRNIQAWTQCGMVPVSYHQLYDGCDPSVDVQITHLLLGEKIWDRLYAKREITGKHLIPAQVVAMLKCALGKMEDQFTADKKREAIVRKKFDQFYEQDVSDKAEAKGAYGAPLW